MSIVRNTNHQFSPRDALYCKARSCDRMSSVRLSVTLVDCDHIGWNSSEIISPLVSLGCSLSAEPNIRVLQGEHPEILAQSDPPLLIWASETFDRKLRPNGYRERNGHNGEPIGNHYRSHRRKQKVNSSAGDSSVSVSRMSDGRLFHKSWTKHEKTSDTQCCSCVWHLSGENWWQVNSRLRGTMEQDRRVTLYTSNVILNPICCQTGSQWSCHNTGVTWSRRHDPVTRRDATFWTDCRRHSRLFCCWTEQSYSSPGE